MQLVPDDNGIKLGGESDGGETIIDGGDTDASLSTSLDRALIDSFTSSQFSLSSISSSEMFGEQLPP